MKAGLAHPPGAQRAATGGGVRQSAPSGRGHALHLPAAAVAPEDLREPVPETCEQDTYTPPLQAVPPPAAKVAPEDRPEPVHGTR